MLFKKIITYIVCCSFLLSGCVTNNGSSSGSAVGPELSSSFFKVKDLASSLFSAKDDDGIPKPKLDIIIPVFDPGLPEDPDDYGKEGIWPELRRAEANRFALKLKLALEKTGVFGAIRVTPDKSATGDLYILGTIEESDGQDVEFELEVVDIRGERWFEKSFDHTVKEAFHNDIRNEGKDPYEPVFTEAAEYLVEELDDYNSKELQDLQTLTDIRFAASFSEETFSQYLRVEKTKIYLASLPSDEDPMLQRVQAIRVRDQLYVDGLQSTYEDFNAKMETSYSVWQKQALVEVKLREAAETEATTKKVLGGLLVIAAVGLAVLGAKSNSAGGQLAGLTGAAVGGIVGAELLSSGFQTSKETEIHRDALNELGKSIDVELAPQVVEFENKTAKLTGDAKDQFQQWRSFLQEMFEAEQTPDVAL